MFGNPVVATALLDSLSASCIVVQIKGIKHQMRQHAHQALKHSRSRSLIHPPQPSTPPMHHDTLPELLRYSLDMGYMGFCAGAQTANFRALSLLI